MPAHPSRTLAAVAAAALLLAGPCARADDPPPGRAPADRPANRLAKETSPYLLQHARNPVDWYPWGAEAFERARREGKPIFLSVGYSSCYWCHVMERESFEDAEIARVLNANFVCVKVDREERPDVDAVYMAAVQTFQGSGGWPMTLFLFPDGRPFYGGTYFPPRAGVRPGPEGLTALLDRVQAAWRDHRPDLERDADAVTERIRARQAAADSAARAPLSRLMARAAVAGLVEQYDPQSGGFGFDPDQPKRPKFPEPTNLLFLLDRHRRDPGAGALLARTAPVGLAPASPAPLTMVDTTLDHLARGGIRDQLGGGYHRYSVDRHWQVPHFEKMLYDNALLARAFLAAFETTRDERWRREAGAIFAFVARELTGPEGGFLSALDAETDGDEGAYYVWTHAQVDQSLEGLEPAAIAAFRATYALNAPPNFEGGRYVLLRPAPDGAPADLAASEPARARLLDVRSQRPRPRLDDKVLTAWNGLMIAAYADGFRVLKNPAYREAAERAADFLGKTHRDPDGRLLRTSRAGVARQPAYLDDHAFLAHGLLRLFEATGDRRRLDQARALADRMLTDFADERGGFFDTASGAETLIARPRDLYDGALPSPSAVATLVLVELGRTTGEAKYLDAAGRALAAQSPILARNPAGAPTLVMALEAYLDARPDAPETQPLPGAAAAGAPDEPVAGVPRQVVRVEAAADGPVTPGAEFAVTVTLEVVDGWHLYANPPGAPNLKPTVLELDADQPGVTLVGVDYPVGVRKAPGGSPEPADLYEGRVTLTARLRLDPATAAGARAIGLRLRYQACDDRACLAPAVRPVPVRVTVGAP